MATYYVQTVKDQRGLKNSWEVAKKHGRGTTRISDHNKKHTAVKRARREANKGDKVGVKRKDGSFGRWFTKGE